MTSEHVERLEDSIQLRTAVQALVDYLLEHKERLQQVLQQQQKAEHEPLSELTRNTQRKRGD